MTMKKLLLPIAIAVATTALCGVADAATYRKWHRTQAYASYHRNVQRLRDNDDSIGGYYEHRLNAVRFGSQRWWKIYDEQNGGSQHR
jgi:hypothetical protein